MDVREIRDMTDEEIIDEIEDMKEAEYKLRLQAASGQLEDLTVLKRTRRDIARLKTVQRERELAAQVASEESNG